MKLGMPTLLTASTTSWLLLNGSFAKFIEHSILQASTYPWISNAMLQAWSNE
jgi:hypothetical protein